MAITGSVLVIDSDFESLQSLSAMLAGAGYRVRTATDGELALASVRWHRPDLILLAMGMPGLNGFEVLRLLKSSRARYVPVLLVHPREALDQQVEGLQMGADDFICRPFSQPEVLGRVRTHLELGRLRSAEERVRAEVSKRPAAVAEPEKEGWIGLAMQAGRMYAFEWTPATDELRRFGVGHDAAICTGREWFESIHREDRDRFLKILALLNPVYDTYNVQYRGIRPDGETANLRESGRGFFGSSGKLTRLIGMVADITEQKQAEQSLRRSEADVRQLVHKAPIAIAFVDEHGRIEDVNERFVRIFGYEVEEIAEPDAWWERAYPDAQYRQEVIRSWEECVNQAIREGQDIQPREYQITCKDGTARTVEIFGALLGLRKLLFFNDITERRRVEADIREVKQHQEQLLATQKLESLGVLATAIAHDFNNLVGCILAEADLAMMESGTNSPARESLQRIATLSMRAGEFVRQILAFGGQERPDFERLDVSRLAREMLHLLKISIPKGGSLKIDLPGDLPPIRANSAQIAQVVMNLILNAAEALGGQPGMVSITARRVRLDRAASGTHAAPAGEYVRLQVCDTGSGMTEAVRAKIFDPFFTTKLGGRGLGLASVKEIIRNHGGAIDVMSAPGEGTTFDILLPCAEGPVEQAPQPRVQPAELGPRHGYVLVVEDEDTLRASVSGMLRKRGFLVLEAADGNRAIDLIRSQKERIAVVLLDLTLPGRTSQEVFQEVRRTQPGVKVIFTSAFARDSAASFNGVQAGRFIRKPYVLTELVSVVRDALALDKPAEVERG